MKVYTIETPEIFECYNLCKAKAKAKSIAKEIAGEVVVTCVNIPSFKQELYKALPNGQFINFSL